MDTRAFVNAYEIILSKATIKLLTYEMVIKRRLLALNAAITRRIYSSLSSPV